MSLTIRQKAFLMASSVSALHYDLTVSGPLDAGQRGTLFVILNHTSLSDPFLVARAMGLKGVHARFVTHTAMYERNKWVMDQIGALPIPSTFDGKGDWTREKIRRATARVHDALAAGDNVAIYPSGQLKAGADEKLGGKSMVFDILARFPRTPVVIVELRGLMYSLTSRYFTGGVESPSRAHMIEIFRRAPVRFATRRVPVDVTFHAPRVLPRFDSPRALNAYLEGIVNATPDYGPDWRTALRNEDDIARYRFARTAEAALSTGLDPAILETVRGHLSSLSALQSQDIDAAAIRPEMSLVNDLGLDSLAEVELRTFAEDTFAVSIDPEAQIMTVRDLVVACQGALSEVKGETRGAAPEGWDQPNRAPPRLAEGATIAGAALHMAHAQGLDAIYTYDETATHAIRRQRRKPLVTYRDLITRAIVIARLLNRAYPGEARIGCMLPATPGAAAFTLGVLLSGRTLVPLNWTNGTAALDAAIQTASIDVIFTSEAFLEKAAVPLSPLAISKIVLAEDFRKQAGALDLIAARRLAGASPERVLAKLGNRTGGNDVAVILFTSGSESMPKGVPLSHRNILSNVSGSLDIIGARAGDRLLAFLPPFHSFGLVQLLVLSLVSGVQIVFAPDPRKQKHLVNLIERFGITVVAGTPDFLSGIIEAAGGARERLGGVRLWLSGAQKAPARLRSTVAGLGGALLEGYGITETAPLIAMNRPGLPAVGVGQPISGTTVRIVDPVTKSRDRGTGEEGLILVSGPGVFDGYLGGGSDPFLTLDGTRYYDTGDLGHLDADGNLTISGRLKRFLKPFGEMVNLTQIEDAVAAHHPAGEAGPRVAVTGIDREGARAFIVLHTTDATITREAANRIIKAAGLTNLSFVDHVERVGEIPLLGSGKINHRALPDAGTILARGSAKEPRARLPVAATAAPAAIG